MFRFLICNRSDTKHYGESQITWIRRTSNFSWEYAPDIKEEDKMEAFILIAS